MIRQLLPEPGVLDGEGALEVAYLHPADTHLRVNFVASLDGAVEVHGRSGPLGGPADRAAFMAMRAVADVVMVGAGTARSENYGPVRLRDEVQERRRARGQSSRPPLAVVTARGDLSPDSRMFETDRDVIVYTTDSVAAERRDLAEVAQLVACGPGAVGAERMVADLRARGMGRILCEGGPALARTLFSIGVVDELCLTLAPLLAGAGHRSLTEMWGGSVPGWFHLLGLIEGDGMLIARYGALRP